jgi:hypothetical protein
MMLSEIPIDITHVPMAVWRLRTAYQSESARCILKDSNAPKMHYFARHFARPIVMDARSLLVANMALISCFYCKPPPIQLLSSVLIYLTGLNLILNISACTILLLVHIASSGYESPR